MKENISALMKSHHADVFKKHGCTSEGVDWGPQENRALLRHRNFLALMKTGERCSLLDVGCGYGALLDANKEVQLDYTGIDMVEEMVREGRRRHGGATFLCGNFLDHDFSGESFDYVICNGIMTQKLTASIVAMEQYTRAIIRKMFSICRKGIAFNMMTTHVNFMVPNLFYKNPAEMLAWTMSEISPHVKLDHAYPLYEFMLYVYKDGSGHDRPSG